MCSLEERKIRGYVIAAHSYFRESHKDGGPELCIAVADGTARCEGHPLWLGTFRWTCGKTSLRGQCSTGTAYLGMWETLKIFKNWPGKAMADLILYWGYFCFEWHVGLDSL